MLIKRFSIYKASSWLLVLYLMTLATVSEARVDELEQAAQKYREVAKQQPAASTEKPEPPKPEVKQSKCFHMDRESCPSGPLRCARVDAASVFCCDVDNFRLKEGLAASMTQNTTNLHVLNATIQELDISQAVFRRLASMAVTDGNIGKIVGQFPKYSSIACLNISNNNLTSEKLQPSIARPFAYLFNLTILDASANNLTEFPLSLVHSNRKISVDLSGNNYLLCKYYQNAMDTNNGSLLTVLNYNKTFCAVDLSYQWFKEMLIVPVDHVRIQKELNESCQHIKPPNINCSCHNQRLILLAGEPTTNAVYVDCSNRGLREMPTNLPPNTRGLNVSFNNITSLQAVSDDPTYEDVRRLIADHNDVADILELEGSQFIDHFSLLNISYNKLKTIHTYVWPAKSFDTSIYMGGNYIHCDCNTEKVFKPWLAEHYKIIPDYKEIQCADNMGAVVDLKEYQVCHSPRDWTDYIYYIIALEVLTLVLLISKVSYDYWVFKTAGYLPWPANKMPRLPCDWLCE